MHPTYAGRSITASDTLNWFFESTLPVDRTGVELDFDIAPTRRAGDYFTKTRAYMFTDVKTHY